MRVTSISVSKLFGRFDHVIPLNRDERITIIHGPNGFGKTALLKLVNALFKRQKDELCAIPFETLRVDLVYLGDEVSIELRRIDSSGTNEHGSGTDEDREQSPGYLDRALRSMDKSNILLQYWLGIGDQMHGPYTPPDEFYHRPFPMYPKAWNNAFANAVQDLEDDESVTSRRPLLTQVADKLRPSFDDPYGPLLSFLVYSARVHLITIDRRFVIDEPEQDDLVFFGMEPSDKKRTMSAESAVAKYNREFREDVQEVQSAYAKKSQELDRTFPLRMVEEPAGDEHSDEELTRQLSALEVRRSRFMSLGLLPQEGTEFRLPASPLDDSTRKVLWLYARDVAEKLKVFDELADKVELLKKIINKHFLFKNLEIDSERGLIFRSDEGQELSPTALSSGEQHQLIMVYECLFKLKSDSLLLIDEPEISLHVAWQVEFLQDLRKIIDIAQFDVVIATHSPQIIHDRWDLTVELKAPSKSENAAA